MKSYSNNTFKYDDKGYTLLVSLFTNTGDEKHDLNVSLDIADTIEVVYESRLNDLLVSGHIIYVDKYAVVDRAFNHHFCYLSIVFAQHKKKTDSTVETKEIDENNKFTHIFFVNDIKVLDRQSSVIKYQINFISLHWLKCFANLQYSNYGKSPESILEIIKNCITQQGLTVDDKTFNGMNVDVKVNYITQLNDNLFTTIDYLMHKLYYFPTRDTSVKFIVYDQFEDKYSMLDLCDKRTFKGIFSTLMSFFKSNNENLIQSEPTNIGSLSETIHKVDVYKNTFEKDTFQYDFDQNTFSCNISPSDENINYFNNKIDAESYLPKYKKLYILPSLQFKDYGSYWNNSHATYNRAIDMLEKNDAFILNITGEIRRQPGSVTVIALDRNAGNMHDQNRNELMKMKEKYKAYEGVWIASKVRNIISPALGSFRQQLVLFRNFVPTYNEINELEETENKDIQQETNIVTEENKLQPEVVETESLTDDSFDYDSSAEDDELISPYGKYWRDKEPKKK